MSTILKNKFCFLLFVMILCLKNEARFLDKTYYLVDSIESAGIDAKDRDPLDAQIKQYRSALFDTAKM